MAELPSEISNIVELRQNEVVKHVWFPCEFSSLGKMVRGWFILTNQRVLAVGSFFTPELLYKLGEKKVHYNIDFKNIRKVYRPRSFLRRRELVIQTRTAEIIIISQAMMRMGLDKVRSIIETEIQNGVKKVPLLGVDENT